MNVLQLCKGSSADESCEGHWSSEASFPKAVFADSSCKESIAVNPLPVQQLFLSYLEVKCHSVHAIEPTFIYSRV